MSAGSVLKNLVNIFLIGTIIYYNVVKLTLRQVVIYCIVACRNYFINWEVMDDKV